MTAATASPPRTWWRRHHDSAISLLAAAPAVLFLGVLYFFPMVLLLSQSVENGSLVHYERALTDGLYVRVLLDTLLVAAYVSIACLLLGYPVAYLLSTASRAWFTVGMIFVLLPLWTSVLVRTYAWMVMLGRNGIVNRVLLGSGLIDAPLPLINNVTGVIIGMVHVLLPYMILPIYGAMKRIDMALVLAAEGMGASGWQVFRRIYLPLTLPGVFAGTTLVFVLSLGFFITPALLGGGKVMMIAVLIEQQVQTFLNWGFAAALSAVLLTVTLVVYALLRLVLRGNMRWT